MGVIFISHSSQNNPVAIEMRDWLANEGWSEVFLDFDPVAGLAPGQHWQDELRKAGERCSAVMILVSPDWATSRWCEREFSLARELGKEIFPVLVSPTPSEALPPDLMQTYQFADISRPDIKAAGLDRLRIGLRRAGLDPRAFRWPPAGEPGRPFYRGLRILEEPDAGIFFGRDAQITKALDALRRMRDGTPERVLAILGASGAGKSSFLRAGLLARLKRDEERFLVLPTVRPGRAAMTGATGLRSAFGMDGPLDSSSVAKRFAALRAPVVERLRQVGVRRPEAMASKPPTVILPIDQAEELFVAGDEECVSAMASIAEAVKADPNFLIMLTIRSDAFPLLQEHARLAEVPRSPFDLPTLSTGAFKEVIEGPARLSAAGIEVDSDLTDQLIEDFDGPDALPLLAFTLERLVLDHGGDGRLAKGEYVDEMRGVEGAIERAVELAFDNAAQLPDLPRTRSALDRLARRAFVPGLVRVDDPTAPPKRRVALRSRLPQDALPLIDCLVDQRLLVADTDGQESTVEVAHEAVLRHWRKLAGWIALRRDELSLAEQVKAAARDWQMTQQQEPEVATDRLLHRGEVLLAAEKLLKWDDLRRDMGPESQAYLEACRKAEDRQRRSRRRLWQGIGSLVVAAAVITALGAGLVFTGQRNLGRAQSLTLARTAESAQDADPLHAVRLSILASQKNALLPAGAEASAALASSAQTLKLTRQFEGHEGAVVGARYFHGGGRVLTWGADGTARLWDTSNGVQIGPALRHDGPIKGAIFSKDEARILTWSEDGSARLWDTATGLPLLPPLHHDSPVNGASFSGDQKRILTWSDDLTARLWDTATGAQVGPPLEAGDQGPVQGAIFSPDQSRVLTWSLDTWDAGARLWDPTTGAQVGPTLHPVSGAVFSRDGKRLLTWSDDRTARLWDVATWSQIGSPMQHDDIVDGAEFSGDESRILTWARDGTARIWRSGSGGQVGPSLPRGAWFTPLWSRDESRVLTANGDIAMLIDAASGNQIATMRHADVLFGAIFSEGKTRIGTILGAAFSAEESRILTWGDDGTARLWDAATSAEIGPALKHDGSVYGASFSPDGSSILSWSEDGTARLWNAATDGQIGPALKHAGQIWGAAFSPDASRILTWSADGTARLWNPATGAQVGPALQHDGEVTGAVFSRDGSRILTSSRDNTARLWDARSGSQATPAFRHEAPIDPGYFFSRGNEVPIQANGAVFSPDERRILTWSQDHSLRLWDAGTGASIGPALLHDGPVTGAAFSHDGRRILSWSQDSTARLWDATTGAPIGPKLEHGDKVNGAAFSEAEDRILTWSEDGTARLWNASDGKPVERAFQHEGDIKGVLGALFSKDESRILTRSEDGTARLWDAATGNEIGPPLRQDANSWVNGAVFSRDESHILTWGSDGTARVWDAATGTEIGKPLRHGAQVWGAAYSRDERRILTWGDDNAARLWDASTGQEIGRSPLNADSVNGAVWSQDQKEILTWSADGSARLWDGTWAMRDPADPAFVPDLCREKLVGLSVPLKSGILAGARNIDSFETSAAPILRGREGEDVCAAPPTTFDTLRTLLPSW